MAAKGTTPEPEATVERWAKGTKTITADALCALTGLTDRRHRDLAKAGYFPPPLRGVYSFDPTVQGMFRHYRELMSRARENMTEENLGKIQAERKLIEHKLAQATNKVLPTEIVEAVWQEALSNMKDVIMAAPMSDESRRQIMRSMQTIPISEYVEAKTRASDDDSSDES